MTLLFFIFLTVFFHSFFFSPPSVLPRLTLSLSVCFAVPHSISLHLFLSLSLSPTKHPHTDRPTHKLLHFVIHLSLTLATSFLVSWIAPFCCSPSRSSRLPCQGRTTQLPLLIPVTFFFSPLSFSFGSSFFASFHCSSCFICFSWLVIRSFAPHSMHSSFHPLHTSLLISFIQTLFDVIFFFFLFLFLEFILQTISFQADAGAI